MEKYPPASGVICPAICILAKSGVMVCAAFPREVQRVSIVLKPILMAWRISFSSKVGSGGGEAPEGGHGEKRGSPCSGTAQFMSCRISEAPVARMAPSRMRAWHPSEECRSTVLDSSIPRKQTRWHQRSLKILVFRSTRRQKSKI